MLASADELGLGPAVVCAGAVLVGTVPETVISGICSVPPPEGVIALSVPLPVDVWPVLPSGTELALIVAPPMFWPCST